MKVFFLIVRNVLHASWCDENKELWNGCKMIGSHFSGINSRILGVLLIFLGFWGGKVTL